MAQFDYGGYKSTKKKYLEGIIPIIILILIGVVIAAKMGWISGIPFLGSLFGGGKNVHIAVLGDLQGQGTDNPTNVTAPLLEDHLKSASMLNYHYQEFDNLDTFKYSGKQLLDNFDMVIVTGERDFPRKAKEALGEYIKEGGKVIIIGDAAIRDPNEPNVVGWKVDELAGTVPVQLPYDVSINQLKNPVLLTNVSNDQMNKNLTLSFLDLEHPIYSQTGTKATRNFQLMEDIRPECVEGVPAIPITPSGGNVLAILEGASEEGGVWDDRTVVGIASKGTTFGGTVTYFSYDPGCMPSIFDEMVESMLGRQ